MINGMELTARAAKALLIASLCLSGNAMAQIYKVVDDDGNVTYTDQAPSDGSTPMVLPELSVVDTDYAEQASAADAETEVVDPDAPVELTPREMRKLYQDFRITRPAQDETFWGTANTVVVSWGSSESLQANMKVRVFVDGAAQGDSGDGMLALTLDRGQHSVYAELLDARGRTITTTPMVTFFVKQNSVGMIQPNVSNRIGN